ncbi:MAG TPA: sialidase family protein [Pirellulales bacterium]|nr:sialidase family protein [Pirellulales bacterium]
MNEHDFDRREFLKRSLGCAAVTGLAGVAVSGAESPGKTTKGILFEGFAVEARRGVQEATLAQPDDARYWLLFGEQNRLVVKESHDRGRTWSEPKSLSTADGSGIRLARDTAHLSLLRLKSGLLGIVYGGPVARPGRDGTVEFRSSADGGQTWSAPVVVDPLFAICRTQGARVLSTGRIVAPVMAWLSSYAGGDSESENNSLVYTWIYYSDDEGQTWRRSHSELFVSFDMGRGGGYSFEESMVEERRDGSLLLYGRTEFGRPYRSVSADLGVSWSSPEPVELACGYTPTTLIRIPQTGDLLLVWNQVSIDEILSGLHRHRLSTAVSRDDGATWEHFLNLESLDDRTEIEPPSAAPRVYRMKDYAYRQPTDRDRYPHAPGCLRICYPTVAFGPDEVTIAYDYGFGGSGALADGSVTKIKIVSLDGLYGRV